MKIRQEWWWHVGADLHGALQVQNQNVLKVKVGGQLQALLGVLGRMRCMQRCSETSFTLMTSASIKTPLQTLFNDSLAQGLHVGLIKQHAFEQRRVGRAGALERQCAGSEYLTQNQPPCTVQVYKINFALERKAQLGHERSRDSAVLLARKHSHIHVTVGPQRSVSGGANHKCQLNFFMRGKGVGYLLGYGLGHVRILLWLIAT